MNVNGPILWSKSTSKMRLVSGFGSIIRIVKALLRIFAQLSIQRCLLQTYFLPLERAQKQLSERVAYPEENHQAYKAQVVVVDQGRPLLPDQEQTMILRYGFYLFPHFKKILSLNVAIFLVIDI